MSLPPLAVVIAAINEEKGIGPTICELKTTLDEPHLVVVDGRSLDKTVEIAKDLGADVLIQKGEGKGSAISQGLDQLDEKTAYVIFTDADYTYPAKYIKEMALVLEEEPNVGMVLGDRFSRRYEVESDKNQFYIGNRILAVTQNILNGFQLNDPLTGLRVIRYDLVNSWKPKSQGFGIEVELNYFVERLGYEIVEIPIIYRKRLGKKKLGFRHGLRILRRIIVEILRNGN
ncbi:glycosyltransferase family 2 protein [Thermoproteota archaeon]